VTVSVYEQYVSDNGSTFQRKTLTDVAAALGNTTEALGAHPKVPSSIKPRYVLGKDATTGREVRLIIGDPTNTIWTTATTVSYPNPNNRTGTARTLNVAGRVAEKRYAR
jgi:hypothetical protein